MKKRTGTPPRWAELVVTTVCAKYGRREPKLHWYQRQSQPYSSGHCKVGSTVLHITAGTSITDQQYVLLHELAHYLTVNRQRGRNRRSWHNKRFHANLLELLEAYGDEGFREYCIRRETEYMKRAAAVMKP